MSNPQHEPTMEEILASIRKIISEDGPENAAPPAEAAAPPPAAVETAPAPQAAHHDDVLELTHEVEEAPPPPMPAPAAPAAEDLVFESVEPTPVAAASEGHSDIFSDHTRRAMEDTFASMDEEEEPAPAPVRHAAPLAPVDGSSVESVFERAVRESFEPVLQKHLSDNSDVIINRMKPLIREWMDEHFPALLEGAVRAEVERVVKSRGTKR